MEIRQLRYFVTLAEELHFGRAAAREHIVQSALSQQVQRLERELGVALVERNTHFVRLTVAGEAFLVEARGVLRSVERAAVAAQQASAGAEILRVSVGDPSLDSMPQVLRNVQYNYPNLVVHRIEAPVPEQYRMLAEGTLDIGVGRASHAPDGVASELFRLDPMGVLVSARSPLAAGAQVPVGTLAERPLLMGEDARVPEFNQFVTDLCAQAGVRAGAVPRHRAECPGRCPSGRPARLRGARAALLRPAPARDLLAAARAGVPVSVVVAVARQRPVRGGSGGRRFGPRVGGQARLAPDTWLSDGARLSVLAKTVGRSAAFPTADAALDWCGQGGITGVTRAVAGHARGAGAI